MAGVSVQVEPSVHGVPFTVTDWLARAELGIALAATASDGALVELVTVGTSQEGHEPDGAAKEVTVPLPLPFAPCGTVKLKIAAELVPEFVTVALVPAAPVIVVPTVTVAAAPAVPVAPVAPVGMPRLRVWLGAVPVTEAVAELPALSVETVPIASEFAGPVAPVDPVAPVAPGGPCGPAIPATTRAVGPAGGT